MLGCIKLNEFFDLLRNCLQEAFCSLEKNKTKEFHVDPQPRSLRWLLNATPHSFIRRTEVRLQLNGKCSQCSGIIPSTVMWWMQHMKPLKHQNLVKEFIIIRWPYPSLLGYQTPRTRRRRSEPQPALLSATHVRNYGWHDAAILCLWKSLPRFAKHLSLSRL